MITLLLAIIYFPFIRSKQVLNCSPHVMRPMLTICVFLQQELEQTVLQYLSNDRYATATPLAIEAFHHLLEQQQAQIDCLILTADARLPSLAKWLQQQSILLPTVIITADATANQFRDAQSLTYHTAEVYLSALEVAQIEPKIEQAIAQFLNLSPACRLNGAAPGVDFIHDRTTQTFLLLQQQRLAAKLKERLGYLGVYYKRNPQNFLRHLQPTEAEELLAGLKADYRHIVLSYFADDDLLNERIDNFVNTAFFTDIPVSQVVEIHMELMDEFSKHLKLEGRSEEILLDYRLTLIDTIAHLCEMYRRSIPKAPELD
jgi:circadian clock protein KaiA